MRNLKGKLNGTILRLGDIRNRIMNSNVVNSRLLVAKEIEGVLDDLRRIRDEEAQGPIDAVALVDECAKQPYFQVQTSEGLRPAFACVADDGARALVIAIDPLSKYPIRPDAEVFEELIWLKGEKTKKGVVCLRLDDTFGVVADSVDEARKLLEDYLNGGCNVEYERLQHVSTEGTCFNFKIVKGERSDDL